MHTSPPKAPLAFRVGIVGHRPKRRAAAKADLPVLASVLNGVLGQVRDAVVAFPNAKKDLYGDAAPRVRAISPLAEGSDRLFARAAVNLEFELCCPFPFAPREYEEDFKPGLDRRPPPVLPHGRTAPSSAGGPLSRGPPRVARRTHTMPHADILAPCR
jgi:hypothetical protein